MMSTQHENSNGSRPRTLEYRQAMKDFHIMFPNLDKDVIECVLRSNGGHVDSTIDQLLQLTTDNQSSNRRRPDRLYHTYDSSTDSSCSISSELHERTSSSEEEVAPPRYTPRYEPPPPAFDFSSVPVHASRSRSHPSNSHKKTYRDWNPPLLGALPPDFLRLYPIDSAFQEPGRRRHHRHHSANPSKSRRSSEEPSNAPPHRPPNSSQPLHRRRTTGQLNVVVHDRPAQSHHHRMVMVDTPQQQRRINHPSSPSSSSSESRRHLRSKADHDQYVEDQKFALLLQNEEFMKELQRNDEFLKRLNEDSRPKTTPTNANPREQYGSIHVDPLAELPRSSAASEDDAFKESVKHMGKSARKSFNDIAKRFSSKRKSYKAMNNIDPVFANCPDEDIR
uniref:CUE domain-containing protein 1-like n=1 Tax=Phallusia mammillata TaxID=59560 RepID=A0A6F9DA30_9ASCI|nr:CUE domain-containing protein 1-like [Phallusia mammillata]